MEKYDRERRWDATTMVDDGDDEKGESIHVLSQSNVYANENEIIQ